MSYSMRAGLAGLRATLFMSDALWGVMIILLRQIKTGLFLSPDGCWTTERNEARLFKSVREAVALMPALTGPLELYYDVGDATLDFTVPLEPMRKPEKGDSTRPG